MTWSIVARDAASGRLALAIATCAFAVGGRAAFVRGRVGAIASQSFINPFYGLRGLELLAAGAAAEDVVRIVTTADPGRSQRQLHLVDAAGRAAAYTGDGCVDWAGHAVHDGWSVAGNMLTGPEVVAETARAFAAGGDLPLPRRLIAAMRAGEAAGGDKRGRQSAALVICDDEEYPLLDLRVDDHADPLAELARLEAVSRGRYLHFRKFMPRRADPVGLTDRAEIEAAIAASLAAEADA